MMNLSLDRLFYAIASLIAGVAILYFAKELLIPLGFGVLFASILYPLVKRLTNVGVAKGLAITLTIFGVLMVILGVLFLFSTQIINIASEYTNFIDKLSDTMEASINLVNERIGFLPTIEYQDLIDRISSFFSNSSFVIISDTVNLTSSFLSYAVLSLIYTFLLLLYSEHIRQSAMKFGPSDHRQQYGKMLKQVQLVGQQYFTGLIILIVILGILNSIGLLILGIDYPFFFGILAALLAVIPYVGTTLGGLLPTLYAFVSYDSYWYPIGVIAIFWFIQFVEGNFLNPKIIGGNLRLNALFSIIALIAGGYLWGLSGMILFLPFVAMIKVVCGHYEELQPIAALLDDPREGPAKLQMGDRIAKLFGRGKKSDS